MATGGSISSNTRLALAQRRGMQLPPSRIPALSRVVLPSPVSVAATPTTPTTTPTTPTITPTTSTTPTMSSAPRRLEIIHEDKQYRKRKKEARRAEIVSAVTRRLYSTKKEKPLNPAEASEGQTEQVVATSTDEPDELKLCSNARARLQEIGRKVMRRMRRQGVDVETQTDFGPVVQRVREVAVQTSSDQRASSATQTGYLGWNYSCHAVNSHADIPKSPTILGCVTRSMQTQSSEKCTKEVAIETEMPFRQSFYLNYQRRCKSRGAPPSYSIVFRKRINRVENEYYSDDSLEGETKETPPSKVSPGKSLGAAEACALIRELRSLFIDWQKHAERNRPSRQVESRPVQTEPEFRIRERENHANVRVCFSENKKKSDDNDEDGLREGVPAPPPPARPPPVSASSMFIPWNILNMYIMKSLMNMPHFPKPPEETKSKPEPTTSQDFDCEPALPKRAPSPPAATGADKQQDRRKAMQDMILGRDRQTYPFNIEIEEETERKVKKSTKKKSVSWTDLSGSGSLHTEIGVRERRSSLDIVQPCRPPATIALTPPPVTAVQMTAFIKEAGHLVKSLTKIQKNQVKHKEKIQGAPPPPPASQEKGVQTDRRKRPQPVYFQDEDNDPDLDPLPQIQPFDEGRLFEPETFQVKPPRDFSKTIGPLWGELVSPRVHRERLLRVRRNIVAEERVSTKF